MGTRKNEPQRLQQETNYEGAFKSYAPTPEEEALEAWAPDNVLLDAGTKAAFGSAKQNIIEGTGGYSGVNNPVLSARMQQIGLQELADQESSAMADANLGLNQLKLQNKQYLAGLRKPQYVQTRTSGYGEQPQQSSGILSSIIGGGSSIAAAF